MNVVAYIRVSTQAQAEEDKFGLEVQRQQIEDYCRENGHTILRWYVDRGESGAKERNILNQLLDTLTNPETEAIVIAKNDRLARDVKLFFWYKYGFLRKNIRVLSVAENYDENDFTSVIMESIVAAFAQFERDRIRDRTTAGRRAKASIGGYCGGIVPTGYTLVNGAWVVDEERADIVRKIFALRESGMTLVNIAATLNDSGIRPARGKQFYASSVRGILENEKYYRGLYRFGKETDWVQGQHEAILKD